MSFIDYLDKHPILVGLWWFASLLIVKDIGQDVVAILRRKP